MTRFRKGTTDHDGDGRMGGSNPGGIMAKKAAKKAKDEPAKEAEVKEIGPAEAARLGRIVRGW